MIRARLSECYWAKTFHYSAVEEEGENKVKYTVCINIYSALLSVTFYHRRVTRFHPWGKRLSGKICFSVVVTIRCPNSSHNDRVYIDLSIPVMLRILFGVCVWWCKHHILVSAVAISPYPGFEILGFATWRALTQGRTPYILRTPDTDSCRLSAQVRPLARWRVSKKKIILQS